MDKSITICDDHSTAESDEQLSDLDRLIDDARQIGCEPALRKHDHNVGYLTDEKRSAYLDIVDVRDHEDVLEIGASMGQHTRLIAKQCNTLNALEVVAKQAEFAKLWCEESGADNVKFTVGGASGTLPYPDGAFNVVIMNYVLEWSAGRNTSGAAEFHQGLLAEIFRVLKPGGRFFLSTKNRYSLKLILGSDDEHLGIRFGSALPRPLGNALARRVTRTIPFGYLHSRPALEKILRSVGFSELKAFLSFPDARRPDVIVPFEHDRLAELGELDKSAYSKKDQIYLSLPTPLKKQHATSHTFIAIKGD